MSSPARTFAWIWSATIFLSASGGIYWAFADDNDEKNKILAGMSLPEYDEKGALIRPVGYERWTFVGTSLGIRYIEGNDPPPKGPGDFHHVYIQPQAYDYFVRFGEFPEKTSSS
jgi:hypothetical protein